MENGIQHLRLVDRHKHSPGAVDDFTEAAQGEECAAFMGVATHFDPEAVHDLGAFQPQAARETDTPRVLHDLWPDFGGGSWQIGVECHA